MEAWVIVLIVLGGVLILTYFVSLLCFFLTNVRIFTQICRILWQKKSRPTSVSDGKFSFRQSHSR